MLVRRVFCSVTFPQTSMQRPPIISNNTPLHSRCAHIARDEIDLENMVSRYHYRRPVIRRNHRTTNGFSSWRVFLSNYFVFFIIFTRWIFDSMSKIVVRSIDNKLYVIMSGQYKYFVGTSASISCSTRLYNYVDRIDRGDKIFYLNINNNIGYYCPFMR